MKTNVENLEYPAASPSLWLLDPAVTFLNHGSFGACPRAVLDYQSEIRKEMEFEPVTFFVRQLESRLDEERHHLALFLDADPDGLVLIPNATVGVNAVLRSLSLEAGDEILVTDHEYNACRNALDFVADQRGARVVVVPIPFPLKDPSQVLECLLAHVTDKTRLLLIDHVTSQTGMVMPLEEIIPEMQSRGVRVLVDGAHAAGMLDLSLRKLSADYYTGNCHKWLCTPKGSGFLWTSERWRSEVRPVAISHGANSPRRDRSRYLVEFGWTGTWDPSAMLSTSFSIQYMRDLVEGGWEAIRERNRRLTLEARKVLCQRLECPLPCPDSMLGSLASLAIPDSAEAGPSDSPLYLDALQNELLESNGIEVPVIPWPEHPKRLLRISCQLYNALPQYVQLAKVLAEGFGIKQKQ